MFLFLLVEDPKSIASFVLITTMSLGSVAENVSIQTYFLRHLPVHIRGSLIGTTTALGTVGMFVFSLIGGVIYDVVWKKGPFLIVGVLDFLYLLMIIYLKVTGRFDES